MGIKIIKIDGEFVIVELNNGELKVCPCEIYPVWIEVGYVINIIAQNK